VKDALLEALGGVPGARGSQLLEELALHIGKASRAKLAEVLAVYPEARPTLLRFSADPDPAVRANAVWSLGGSALEQDIPRLVRLREDDDIAVASNAVAAFARTAARLGLGMEPLCAALEDRRSYVLVNALAGLRLAGTACRRAELPAWLLQHHPSDEVRIAAAALIRERSELTPGAASILARCVRKDVSGRVAAACNSSQRSSLRAAGASESPSEPASAARSPASESLALGPTVAVSVLVVPTGSSIPTARAPFALVRADGLIRSGTSDRRGSVSEAAAPRGALRLAVPAVFAE